MRMNAQMASELNGVYTIPLKDIDEFVTHSTKEFYQILIFGVSRKVKITRLNQTTDGKVYIHVMVDYPDSDGSDEYNINITIDPSKRVEFGLSTERNLIDTYKYYNLKTPKESEMFGTFKIKSVTFDEVNDVALEAAIEKIAGQLEGVEMRERGGEMYLIKDGKAIAIKGDEFVGLVEKYMVGKTVNGLRSNKAMYTLISNLGIVKRIELESESEGLDAIFG